MVIVQQLKELSKISQQLHILEVVAGVEQRALKVLLKDCFDIHSEIHITESSLFLQDQVMNEPLAARNVVKVLDVRADLITMKGCQSSLFCLAQELVQDQDSRRACTK